MLARVTAETVHAEGVVEMVSNPMASHSQGGARRAAVAQDAARSRGGGAFARGVPEWQRTKVKLDCSFTAGAVDEAEESIVI